MSLDGVRLVTQLLDTHGQGIAAFVQEHVHSTSIGVDATADFVKTLLEELEGAIRRCFTIELEDCMELTDKDELELGTLISAASLTIRYVTERDAIIPVLDRFRIAFQTVLRYSLWTKPMLGLKMVSIMGSTRQLESFHESVPTEAVADDLRWVFSHLIASNDEGLIDPQRLRYLFRPACEQLTVVIQSHPMCLEMIVNEILPQLLCSIHTFSSLSTEGNRTSNDQVKTELVSTIAVLFDMKLPPPSVPNAFSLFPMPSIYAIGETEVEEEGLHRVHEEDDLESLRTTDWVVLNSIEWTQTCHELVEWLACDGVRNGVTLLLPMLAQVLHLSGYIECVNILIAGLLTSIQSISYSQPIDFEYHRFAMEALRDLGLRNVPFTSLLHVKLYSILAQMMPQLQMILKRLDVEKTQMKTIKTTCSSIRTVLAEVLVIWIHQAGTLHHDSFIQYSNDLITNVVNKIADPRIHGDILYVTRQLINDEETLEHEINQTIKPLQKALTQLRLYSKDAIQKILAGVARVAFASGEKIVSFADNLVQPLLDQIESHTIKSKHLGQYLSTIGCIWLSCAREDSFLFEDHEWIKSYVHTLLEIAGDGRLYALSTLSGLVRSDRRIRSFVAEACVTESEIVRHLVIQSLGTWPIYEEDVDTVLMVIGLLESLFVEPQLCSIVDMKAMANTVSRLSENANSDGMTDVAEACRDLLKVLEQIIVP